MVISVYTNSYGRKGHVFCHYSFNVGDLVEFVVVRHGQIDVVEASGTGQNHEETPGHFEQVAFSGDDLRNASYRHGRKVIVDFFFDCAPLSFLFR